MNMSPEEALKKLDDIACINNVRHLAAPVIDNPKFVIWSGSSNPNLHHYGKGGLVIHTCEVTQMAMMMNITMKAKVNKQKLFLSCLYHDVGKIWDYEPVKMQCGELGYSDYAQWTSTKHKKEIYHIQRSALVWNEVARKQSLGDDFTDDITHAILAHHGQPEWGSPVKPQTKMAWLVHLADMTSARMYDCDTNERLK